MATLAAVISWMKTRTSWQLVWVFSLVNLMNNLDRGIIPGAFDSITEFIRDSGMGDSQTNALLGVLQSCFIVGYSVAAVSLGHLVHRYPPFKLMTAGLVVWVFSCLLGGVSPNYYSLAAARILSGVGEASFQCVVPPYIDTHAPHTQRGTWLAIFYLASPVGQALGYVWGGVIGSSPLTWRAAFYLEVIPVVVLLPLLWVTPYDKNDGHASKKTPGDGNSVVGSPAAAESEDRHLVLEGTNALSVDTNLNVAPETPEAGAWQPETDADFTAAFEAQPSVAAQKRPAPEEISSMDAPPPITAVRGPPPKFWAELRATMSNVLFLLITFGYAGWIAVIMGLGSFGPAFTEGLGMFGSQSEASTVLGASIALAGIIGTLMGGWLVDWETKRRWAVIQKALPPSPAPEARAAAEGDACPTLASEAPPQAMLDLKLLVAMRQSFLSTLAGSLVCFLAVAFAQQGPGPFMVCLSIGLLLLLANTSAVGIGTMACVPTHSRPFAIGLNTLLIHALGDVPSPPIIGYLADSLAPQDCPTCHRSASGLQETLFLVILWLVWPCVLWFAAWILVARQNRARERAACDKLDCSSATS